MLSLKDCTDYCDLTEEEIALIAEHEHLPTHVAATLACGLVQTDEGVVMIDQCLEEMVSAAMRDGQLDKAEHVLHVYAQFRAAHPLAQ
ncbi:hypothetical protein [Uliginosibacterium sp. H1]|uniref:hypothetical protein n=1 Tax=Uliginosibacterium sp. H1 TaxID=3114757 RepID=UPI002E186D7C|nr:hypothetical protein [Uliginosibacterium sp. H1]